MQSKDYVGLVLVGTEKTDNDKADSDGNYAHISITRPIGAYGWDILKNIDAETFDNNVSANSMFFILSSIYTI